MKHILLSIVLFSFSFINVNAQNIFQRKENVFMKPGDYTQGFNSGDSVEEMMKIIGKPDDIINYFFEIDDTYGEIYCYRKNEIYVINGHVDGVHIYDATIAFGILNKFQLKVGDKIKDIIYTRVDINKFDKSASFNDYKPIVYKKGIAYNLDYDAYFSPEYYYDGDDRLDLSFSILFKDDKVLFIATQDYDC